VVLLSIFGVEAQDALPQHESMPPPEEGVAEARQQGLAAPRTSRSMTKPPLHRLYVAGIGLDMDECPGVLCSF
jgi:hypothetical protein